MRRFLSLFTMLMLCGVFAFAQNRVVSGKITDENGNPAPFVSIKIKGTKTGIAADASGTYTIKVKDGDILEISGAGFKTKEISVGSQTFISTTLEKTGSLTEVVVTGAFQTKRTQRSTSSNAQVVSSEQLNTIRQTNINNALAGKVAGIQLRGQSAASLDASPAIRLRGESGFGASSGAIYVVDGTVLPNANDVNTDDIEDVTVLQGPSAAALFGPQGTNGAIVITLKKARKNARGSGIEINSGVTFDKIYILPNYQNSYAGGDNYNLTKFNYQAGQPEGWKALDGKYYPDYSDDASWGPRMVGQEYIPWYAWYPGTEYSFKTAKLTPQPTNTADYYNTGITKNNNINFSKAGDNYNFRASYSNLDIQGLIPTTSLKRNTFNVNTSFDLNSRLTLGANINYLTQNTNGEFDQAYGNQSSGSFNSWFHRDLDMNIMKELRGLKSPDGTLASWNHLNPNDYNPANPGLFYGANYWFNFYTYFDYNSNLNHRDRTFGDVSLTYKVNSDLKVRITYRKQQNDTYFDQKFRSELESSGGQTGQKAYYGVGNTYSNRQNYEGLITYSKKIKDFQIGANAGTDIFKARSNSTSTNTNNGFNVPNLFNLSNSKNPVSYGNGISANGYRAIFITGNVGFRNYLFADFTLRKDWVSELPADNNGIFIKSFGGSFIFSDLIKDKLPALSYGKIRASWGETPASIGVYQYPGFSYAPGANQWNGNFLMGTPDVLVDPKIHGAVNTQREIGADLRFLKNRIGISVTYWDATVKDFPYQVAQSPTSGFTAKLINTGEIAKKGVDVQLNLKPIWSKNFQWDMNATWGRLIKNEVISIAPGIDRFVISGGAAFSGITPPYTVNQVGQEWGIMYGGGYKRINGQPVLDGDGHYVQDPNVNFGSVLPKYTGGFQNTFNIFKNFIINVNIDYQVGGKFFSLSDMWGSYSGLTARTAVLNDKGNSVRDAVADGGGIHVFGVDATGKPVDYYVAAKDYYHTLVTKNVFDDFIYDLTFVKLRELSLGYKIPLSTMNLGKWLQSATFSVTARNPWLIYAKTKDFDPSEINSVYGEDGQYPGTRSVGVNLKLGF
ncbi:MAG: SusC/RagA family TonB-linked outer membrane protein [Ferruginibacter sp.]